MDTLNLPTKRNLLLAKQRLALAQKGYDLLDKKRQVLSREFVEAKKVAQPLWKELCEVLGLAYAALDIAQGEMGQRLQKISQNIPNDMAVNIYFCSIMGVAMPRCFPVKSLAESRPISYSLAETTVSFDEAVQAWKKAREFIVSWAAIENTMYELNHHIKKTQKRANALGNITIPTYVARIKYIQEQLEERERDELARLKLVKERSQEGRPSEAATDAASQKL